LLARLKTAACQSKLLARPIAPDTAICWRCRERTGCAAVKLRQPSDPNRKDAGGVFGISEHSYSARTGIAGAARRSSRPLQAVWKYRQPRRCAQKHERLERCWFVLIRLQKDRTVERRHNYPPTFEEIEYYSVFPPPSGIQSKTAEEKCVTKNLPNSSDAGQRPAELCESEELPKTGERVSEFVLHEKNRTKSNVYKSMKMP
jgi:hypothetical protein